MDADRLFFERGDIQTLISVFSITGFPRLAFWPGFDLNRTVPQDVTSLTGIEGRARDGPFAFATTHWSVVLTAQDQSPEADAALEKLCRIYWWPLYGFVRRQGYGPEEAQDLTQG